MNSKLYVVTHKKYKLSDYLKEAGYQLISVGKGNQENEDTINDNKLDNISLKNPNYCELTALYWIWKNDTKSKVKGICHYRRYFTKAVISKKEKYFVSQNDVVSWLEKGYDFVLPYKSRFVSNASYNYLRCGREKDLITTRNVIEEFFPTYVKEFDYVMTHNWSYLTNMMITTSVHWNKYCEWLFTILFEVEKRTDLSGYSVQEKRIYGYLSERLLTVWILHNAYKVKEVRSVNIEEKFNLGYVIREFMIKTKFYQLLKTILWKLKVIKR